MNERIKLLAEQASHQSPDGYPVTIPYSNDFVKKFSLLIVDDIITVVAAQSLLNESALDVYKNLRRIYQGVEPPATNECDSSINNYDF